LDSVARNKILGNNDRKGISLIFNINSPKYVPKYNHYKFEVNDNTTIEISKGVP
jgi:hypothetical protein